MKNNGTLYPKGFRRIQIVCHVGDRGSTVRARDPKTMRLRRGCADWSWIFRENDIYRALKALKSLKRQCKFRPFQYFSIKSM